MRTEVIQIIRGGLAGDKVKVLAYAKLLVENFEKEGNERSARMVRRTYDPDAPKGNTVCFDDDTSLTPTTPCRTS